MTRDELEKRNVGENLDALMNLDPRGYGVCRILYAGSRAYTGEPLTMHAAQVLCDTVKGNDLVYIITGFVLLPHKVPEMDGTVSAMLLARALVMAFGAKPVIVCPDDSVQAIEKCAAVVGLHIYEDLDTVQALPLSMGVVAFTKNITFAPAQATELAARKPAAVVSVEACGANAVGVCHNAVGLDVTALQARSDVLWDTLRANGVPNIAIGDLVRIRIHLGVLAVDDELPEAPRRRRRHRERALTAGGRDGERHASFEAVGVTRLGQNPGKEIPCRCGLIRLDCQLGQRNPRFTPHALVGLGGHAHHTRGNGECLAGIWIVLTRRAAHNEGRRDFLTAQRTILLEDDGAD